MLGSDASWEEGKQENVRSEICSWSRGWKLEQWLGKGTCKDLRKKTPWRGQCVPERGNGKHTSSRERREPSLSKELQEADVRSQELRLEWSGPEPVAGCRGEAAWVFWVLERDFTVRTLPGELGAFGGFWAEEGHRWLGFFVLFCFFHRSFPRYWEQINERQRLKLRDQWGCLRL